MGEANKRQSAGTTMRVNPTINRDSSERSERVAGAVLCFVGIIARSYTKPAFTSLIKS